MNETIAGVVTKFGDLQKSTGDGWFKAITAAGGLFAISNGQVGFVALFRSADELANICANQAIKALGAKTTVKILCESSLNSACKSVAEKLGCVETVVKSISMPTTSYTHPVSLRIRIEKSEIPKNQVVPIQSNLHGDKTRVLIVDDSKTIRQVLRMIFSRDPDIEVVGECENPIGVEDAISRLKPNVISMDINMPEMDGVTFVKQLLPKKKIAVIMVTALSIDQGDQVLQALSAGAVDYIQKPSLQDVEALAGQICERFKTAAKAQLQRPSEIRVERSATQFNGSSLSQSVILIGASTGGTEALKVVLGGLPANIPPILIVQHIPPAFSKAFASRLATTMPFSVREATDGEAVLPGNVLIAPGGLHMRLQKTGGNLIVRISDGPNVSGHKPSVDALFESAVEHLGSRAVGVILTGMGKDGAQGLLKLRNKGCRTIGQDEATSVVYGMPGAAMKIGAVEVQAPLNLIAARITEFVNGLVAKKSA